jgi:penicillin-binding protein 1A
MLAGLPQNPYYANPITNLARATQRQHVVLQRMRATGVISEAQAAAARAEKLVIRAPGQGVIHAGHVAEMARAVVAERFGAEAYTRGIRVVTSLRAADQRAAWTALRRGVLAYDRKGVWRGIEDRETLPAGDGAELEQAAARALKDHRDDEMLRVAIVLGATPRAVQLQLASGERIEIQGAALRWVQAGLSPQAKAPLALARGAVVRVRQEGKAWAFAQWPQAEAAFVSMDPTTGRVRALVGGFDFGRQPFNHVTQAWRQPGSSFKPLLYSAALEQGVMPGTVIDDAPYVAPNGWSPSNSDGRFEGPLSLREALAKSRNLVSLRVLQQVGVGAAREWAARFGLDAARQPDNLTLALGTGSVTPLQMAQAYAVIANGGYRVAPVLVERITDAQGKVIFEAPPAAAPTEDARAIPARNAFVMGQLLNEVTRSGTAARAQVQLRRPDLYGKTGTTDEAVDAWFAGFQPSLVAVAWMGYDDPRSLGERETGGGLALPIWLDYMAIALKGVPVDMPVVPAGLAQVDGEWLYEEWAAGGQIRRIGADGSVEREPAPLPAPVAPPAAAPADAVPAFIAPN